MDGRRDHRKRTFIGAKILLNGGACVLDCVVKDLSEGGARVSVNGAFAVPAQFDLKLSDSRSFHCRSKWRRLESLGVSFQVL
ncbi:PilZ domain-containing protein [Rhizobium sp. BK399]|uniref:PilZ domain-containing protein n=1 Tax=Rhizobium sp. BK399 TaxID=2587063 RepID=UPI00161A6238|nr:PilZ domain-containing protein [Rhizobium sp. BK399]